MRQNESVIPEEAPTLSSDEDNVSLHARVGLQKGKGTDKKKTVDTAASKTKPKIHHKHAETTPDIQVEHTEVGIVLTSIEMENNSKQEDSLHQRKTASRNGSERKSTVSRNSSTQEDKLHIKHTASRKSTSASVSSSSCTYIEPPAEYGNYTGQAVESFHEVLGHVPPTMFRKAKGIIILKKVDVSVVLAGGVSGSGLAFNRQENGSWSLATSISLSGQLIGLTIGFKKSTVVFFLMNEQVVNRIFFQGQNITLDRGGWSDATVMSKTSSARSPALIAFTNEGGFCLSLGFQNIKLVHESSKKIYGEKMNRHDLLQGKIKFRNSKLRKFELYKLFDELDNKGMDKSWR